MKEDELAKHIQQLQEIGKQNKGVDVASLALAALKSSDENKLGAKEKRWAYLVSLAVPPFGFIFAIKFYLSKKDDSVDAAFICVVLTFLSIILTILFFKLSTSGTGVNLQQIQQINPTDIQQLYQ